MWKIFFIDNIKIESSFNKIDNMKSVIYKDIEIAVKSYIAEKITLYFDYNMLFKQKRGLHTNLIEALAEVEKEAINLKGVFPRVDLYWLQEKGEKDYNHSLAIFNLNDKYDKYVVKEGYSLYKKDAIPTSSILDLECNSWKTIIFDISMVNYAKDWIKYAPSLERRCQIQAESILMNTHLKNKDLSYLEVLNIEKNLANHKSYSQLYEKILRIMPKIENSLMNEWQTNEKEIRKDVKRKLNI